MIPRFQGKSHLVFAVVLSISSFLYGEVSGISEFNEGIKKYVSDMKSLCVDFTLINSAESTVSTINKWTASNEAVFKVLLVFAEKNPDVIKGQTPPKDIAEGVKAFQAASEEVFQSQREAQSRVRQFSSDTRVQIAIQRLQLSFAAASDKVAPLLR
jgi:hypothetical protein